MATEPSQGPEEREAWVEKDGQISTTASQYVDFDSDDDPANPVNWKPWLKWTFVALEALMSTVNTMATLISAPTTPQILVEFHSSDRLYSTILVTIWELGEGVGPFIVAPLAERYGRLPVWHTFNVLYVAFSVVGGFSNSLGMLITMRFFNGLSVAMLTLGPAMIGDMFAPEQQGLAIAIATLPPLIGPTIGPMIGGAISAYLNWRWTFWIIAIAAGLCELLSIPLLRETYVPLILKRKAKRMRKQTGDASLRCRYDIAEDHGKLRIADIARPVTIWVQSPAVAAIAVHVAILYGYLYLIFTTFTFLLEDEYGFPPSTVGIPFLGMSLGVIFGVLSCGLTSDRWCKHRARVRGNPNDLLPEDRLPYMLAGGLLVPAGLFLYGWTAQAGLHWMGPVMGSAVLAFGVFAVVVSVKTYAVSAFHLYSASATAAVTVLQSVAGAVLPLAGPSLFQRLGQGWGSSVMAFIALAFAGVPLLLMRFGERWRQKE